MLGPWMKAVHILTVMNLVGGMLGRGVCFRMASRSSDLNAVRTLAQLGSVFERTMVRPGSFIVLVTGLLAAWQLGWPILGFLQGASVNWVLTALLVYLTIIPLIVLVFLPKGRVFHHALEQAGAQGVVTTELRAALNDPVVQAARVYESLMVVVLVLLMVLKPF